MKAKTVKQPPILFSQTQQILAGIQKRLRAPLITYWNNPRGSVCHSDVVAFYTILERLGRQKRIYLFLKSDGGTGRSSLRIVNLLRQYTSELVAMVPLECCSAATMIAIGANRIQMGPMAYLTPVDTSLTHDLSPIDRDNDRVSVSLDELSRVIRLWKKVAKPSDTNPYQHLFGYVHPLVIGAVDRAESLSIQLCSEILGTHLKSRSAVKAISETLNAGYPSHSYPILLDHARRIGLRADEMPKDINDLLLDLNSLYSEMGQKATTDFDEIHSHGNEIVNILESAGMQIIFQQDKDWFYRREERRWISLNDNSSWRKIEMVDGQIRKSILHIA
jgi:hypothetical protein